MGVKIEGSGGINGWNTQDSEGSEATPRRLNGGHRLSCICQNP